MKKNKIWRVLIWGVLCAVQVQSQHAQAQERDGSKKALAAAADFKIQSSYQVSSVPLTTDQVWVLDPEEPNPQQKRWVLEARLTPVEWAVVRKSNGMSGIRLLQIRAQWTSHLRPSEAGGWLRKLREFPCTREPDLFFATEDGSRFAARESADLYERELRLQQRQLSAWLSRLESSEEAILREKAEEVFLAWTQYVHWSWRKKWQPIALKTEWDYYLNEVKNKKICRSIVHTSRSPGGPFEVRSMESPDRSKSWEKITARTPAQRWDGRLTVRVTLDFGSQSLTGRFLIDTTSEMSLVSGAWLKSMGVNQKLLIGADAQPVALHWAGGKTKGRAIQVFDTTLGGVKMPFYRYWVTDTSAFRAPRLRDTCCEGVLGLDFLKQWVMEILPHEQNPAIQWYARASGEVPVAPDDWVDVDSVWFPGGVLGSPCGRTGVRWNLALPAGVIFSKAGSSKTLNCGGWDWIRDLPLDGRNQKERSPGGGAWAEVGLNAILRGRSIFDLSRGRIWFEKSSLEKPLLINEARAKRFAWVYDFDDQGNRGLRVLGPIAGYPKLQRGDWVIAIQGTNVDALDDWDVQKKTSGPPFGSEDASKVKKFEPPIYEYVPESADLPVLVVKPRRATATSSSRGRSR